EHHQRAMHGEYLAVEFAVQKAAVRGRQLCPHQHGQYAANQEEHQGGDDEAYPHRGVIHGGKPTQTWGRAPGFEQMVVQLDRMGFAHGALLLVESAATACCQSSGGWATTRNFMDACPTPQYSAQVPS